jgi:ABC-type phosphate transport system auxiliary subunit
MKMNPESQLHQETHNSALKELQAEKEVLSARLKELAVEVERLRRDHSSARLDTADGSGRHTSREAQQDIEGEEKAELCDVVLNSAHQQVLLLEPV